MEARVPDVSVVICTRDRVASLIPTLDAIHAAANAAAPLAIELVVVDNGSSDGTSAAAAQWAETAGRAIKIVAEPRPGLAIARNSGMRAAAGEIIVFTDDDCRVEIDYFTTLARLYPDRRAPRMIGGRVLLGDDRDLPVTIKEDLEGAEFAGTSAGGFILGCNMTMTRAAWDKIGQMDERLGAGTPYRSAEDTDYIIRAHMAGVPITYDPSLCVHHFHGRRSLPEVQKLFSGYSVGNGALYAKYFGTSFARQFRWDLQDAVREVFGRAAFKPELGITYRSILIGNVTGMLRYWSREIGRRSQGP